MATEGKQKLTEVMAAIREDPKGMEQFGADPVGYLKRKGIDSEGITLSSTPNARGLAAELTDADLAMVAGGGCFSLGYYGCYNEGD